MRHSPFEPSFIILQTLTVLPDALFCVISNNVFSDAETIFLNLTSTFTNYIERRPYEQDLAKQINLKLMI